MGVLFGLLAALGWGGADFLVAQVSRRMGILQALLLIQLAGLVAIVLVLAVRFGLPAASAGVWAQAAGLAALNMVCTVLLYRSYAIGTLSIVSPITSGFAVVTALLALASGERPNGLALLGALLLVGGVTVVARGQGGPRLGLRSLMAPGTPEAVGAAVGYGVYFWGLDFVTPSLGIVWPVLLARIVSFGSVALWMLHRQIAPVRPPRAVLPLVLGCAVFDTVAFLAFNSGLGSADTTIVTALSSLFSAITVLLAWAVSRERLASYQWAGVGIILAGVLLVSI